MAWRRQNALSEHRLLKLNRREGTSLACFCGMCVCTCTQVDWYGFLRPDIDICVLKLPIDNFSTIKLLNIKYLFFYYRIYFISDWKCLWNSAYTNIRFYFFLSFSSSLRWDSIIWKLWDTWGLQMKNLQKKLNKYIGELWRFYSWKIQRSYWSLFRFSFKP